jgi:hypothetical protein
VLSTPAMAGSLISDPLSSCQTDNCESTRILGSIIKSGESAIPFVIQALGRRGDCVRFDVSPTVPSIDMELVVIAPNGAVFSNDNRNGSDNRPLVRFSAPVPGWYTVHVNESSGANIDANFVLLYGRYTAGNANCS